MSNFLSSKISLDITRASPKQIVNQKLRWIKLLFKKFDVN